MFCKIKVFLQKSAFFNRAKDFQYSISKLFFSFLFAHDNRIISEKTKDPAYIWRKKGKN